MEEIRINRIQSLIKDELSVLINRELKDPRVPSVSVTQVEMTKDAKLITVSISLISIHHLAGSDSEEKNLENAAIMEGCLEGLNQAKGFIKRRMSKVIQLRYMPEFLFKEDKGLENTLRVHELLKQIENEKKSPV